ncbi:MAG: TOBE-like domain-containing protein, partial [Microthrixaceae bacterium]
ADPGGSAVVGEVTRIVRVGFEVRIEVTTAEQLVLVTQTRTQLQASGLALGARVWLRATDSAPTVIADPTATPSGAPELLDA